VSAATPSDARGDRDLTGGRSAVSPVARITESAPLKRFSESAIATPANFVTGARLLLAVPTLLLIWDRGSTWLTVTLWFVLACTDRIDGWLARRDGATRSGAFLDPLADKFLVIGGFLALGLRGDFSYAAVLIVAVREVGISVYRSFAGRHGISLPALKMGKWKAFFQFLAVGVVLFPPTYEWATFHDVILWVAIALTVISGLDILRRGWQEQTQRGADAS
jgi:CDP-diacylglycerol--glycerol-3-phosphate 3-phosphatidyltransferase